MAPSTDTTLLIETATSTATLLQRFRTALAANAPAAQEPEDAPDPLSVLHDAAKLFKAHTTKLSLLVLNKPFTPSAIRKVIVEAANTCAPAMMSAVELCRPEKFGRLLRTEASFRVRKVLQEFENMMHEIIAVATGTPAKSPRNKDSLASTGVVWAACDSLMELKTLGYAGLVVGQAQAYRETLEDAIAELGEWVADDDDEEFEDDAEDSDGIEQFGSDKLPKDREDLKKSHTAALKCLRLVSTLEQAIIKRRLKVLPPDILDVVGTVDDTLDAFAALSSHADEVAGGLYEHDNAAAVEQLQKLTDLAQTTATRLAHDWSGHDDEYTAWAAKWSAALAAVDIKGLHEAKAPEED